MSFYEVPIYGAAWVAVLLGTLAILWPSRIAVLGWALRGVSWCVCPPRVTRQLSGVQSDVQLQELLGDRFFSLWMTLNLVPSVAAIAEEVRTNPPLALATGGMAGALAAVLVVWRMQWVSRLTASRAMVVSCLVGNFAQAHCALNPSRFYGLGLSAPVVCVYAAVLLGSFWGLATFLVFIVTKSLLQETALMALPDEWDALEETAIFLGPYLHVCICLLMIIHVTHDFRLISERAVQTSNMLLRAREDMLSTTSHEMRTPLHAITGVVSTLLSDSRTRRLKPELNLLLRCAHSLSLLIDNVLMLSKLKRREQVVVGVGQQQAQSQEAGQPPNDGSVAAIRETVWEVSAIVESLAFGKQVMVRSEVDANVPSGLRVRASELNQVLLNIAGNAVKFTERGFVELHVSLRSVPEMDGTLAVSFGEEEKRRRGAGDEIVFAVYDTGVGLSAADTPERLFSAFYRGETARSVSGTGLGLHIANSMVLGMGGYIEVGPNEGASQGSVFSVHLPLQLGCEVEEMARGGASPPRRGGGGGVRVYERAPRKRSSPAVQYMTPQVGTARGPLAAGRPQMRHMGSQRRRRIVVVDDNAINRKVAVTMLKRLGHEGVDVCENGAEAVECALRMMQQSAYGSHVVVLLDLAMPVLDGIHSCRLIREVEQTLGVEPANIVALTASSQNHNELQEHGFSAFLRKPAMLNDLKSVIVDDGGDIGGV